MISAEEDPAANLKKQAHISGNPVNDESVRKKNFANQRDYVQIEIDDLQEINDVHETPFILLNREAKDIAAVKSGGYEMVELYGRTFFINGHREVWNSLRLEQLSEKYGSQNEIRYIITTGDRY